MVDQKKKQRPAPAELTRTEAAAEVFTMAHVGGDRNQKVAADRLRRMSSNDRRELRQSIQRLDYLLDDVSLELLARRSRND
jgi:hypothetical protein